MSALRVVSSLRLVWRLFFGWRLWAFALDRNADEAHRSARFVIAVARHARDFSNNLLAFDHLAENRVRAISRGGVQPGLGRLSQEELAAAGVRAADIGHGEPARAVEFQRRKNFVSDCDA